MWRRGMHIGYCWESRRKIPLGREIYGWEDNIKRDLIRDGVV
jgi:hypothetical protein